MACPLDPCSGGGGGGRGLAVATTMPDDEESEDELKPWMGSVANAKYFRLGGWAGALSLPSHFLSWRYLPFFPRSAGALAGPNLRVPLGAGAGISSSSALKPSA